MIEMGSISGTWFVLGIISYGLLMFVLVDESDRITIVRNEKIKMALVCELMCLSVVVHYQFLSYLYVVYRSASRHLMGRWVKLVFELLLLFAASACQWRFGCSVPRLLVLIGFICQFHAIFQLRYRLVDLFYLDLFLQILMQIGVYATGNHICHSGTAILGFSMLISYRCWSYSSKIQPSHHYEYRAC